MEVDRASAVCGGSHRGSLSHPASVAGAAESARAPDGDACTVAARGRKGILPGARSETGQWVDSQRETGFPPPEVPSRPAATQTLISPCWPLPSFGCAVALSILGILARKHALLMQGGLPGWLVPYQALQQGPVEVSLWGVQLTLCMLQLHLITVSEPQACTDLLLPRHVMQRTCSKD